MNGMGRGSDGLTGVDGLGDDDDPRVREQGGEAETRFERRPSRVDEQQRDEATRQRDNERER